MPSAAARFHWSNWYKTEALFKANKAKEIPIGTRVYFIRMGGAQSGKYRVMFTEMENGAPVMSRVPPSVLVALGATYNEAWDAVSLPNDTQDFCNRMGQYLHGRTSAFIHNWT